MKSPKKGESEKNIIYKKWGKEIIIENNDNYCGKLLCFNKGSKFSFHYHLVKEETWYVNEGEFIYRWIDTDNANIIEECVFPGDIIKHKRGQPHQLETLTGGVIFEVSTTHYDHDSYRIFKGDSQNDGKI